MSSISSGLQSVMLMMKNALGSEVTPLQQHPEFNGLSVALMNPSPRGLIAPLCLKTSYSLVASLDSAGTVDAVSCFMEANSSARLKVDHQEAQVTGTGDTILVSAPGVGIQKLISSCYLTNVGVAARTVTLKLKISSTTYVLRRVQLDPNASLNLSDSGWTASDDALYLRLSGRSGGQFAYGGTGAAENLELRGSANASIGRVIVHMLQIADDSLNPSANGDITRVGSQLRFYNGNVRAIAPFNATGSYVNGRFPIWSDVTSEFDPQIFALANKVSPSISANQNDWNPTGLASASVLRVSCTGAGREITGIAAGSLEGRFLLIENVGSLFLTLKNESASSAAANRLSLGATDISLWTGDSILLEYDVTSQRWRCISRSVSVPAFGVYPSGTTSCGSSADTLITNNTEEFDTHSWFDNATNYRFQPLMPGKYQCNWLCTISSTPTTAKRFRASLFKNGSLHKGGTMVHSSVADAVGSAGAALVTMNGSSDYLDLRFFHDNGSSLNVGAGPTLTFFNGARAGE